MTFSAPARVDGPALAGLDRLVWVADIPRIVARRHPDRIAIVFAERGERVTYADLDRRADAFAALLATRGVKPGDRVAYLGRNSDLYFPVLFGAIRAGVVLVPLNWRLAPPEIAYQLQDSGTRLLFCDPELHAVADLAIGGIARPPVVIPNEGVDGECLRELLRAPAPPVDAAHDRDQLILLLYTSGTTGSPKGVMISHGALSIARHCELQMPGMDHMGEGCIILSPMPSFHSGGLSWVLMGLIRMGTVVLTADPSPGNLLQLMREYRIGHTFIVPTVLRAMVDRLATDETPPPRIEGLFYGAMAVGASLLRESIALLGCRFGQYFGMTENTGSATYLDPEDHDPARPHLLASVGKPYPGMSVEIRDPSGQVLRRGQHGEIWIRSPTALLGYWNKPQQTREALQDGWYASGDGGYLDGDGFLHLTDRIKDMIVSGGENVYPAEVEEAVRQHPAVLDVAVIALPDRRWGEAVSAIVELRPAQRVGAEELCAFVRTRIAGYKSPKRVHFIDVLPRTASGKVRRAELRERYRDATKDVR